VLKALEQDLLRIVTRKTITEPFANLFSNLLSGTTSTSSSSGGGDLWAMLAKMAASYFTGGSSGWTSGYDLPMGGYANGTNYAPGGFAMVGEQGPEAMYVPRGAQIIPHERLQSMRSARDGPTIVQNINVLPGTSHQSRAQAAGDMIRAARLAGRNQ
jgi:SLT domain-containing protein